MNNVLLLLSGFFAQAWSALVGALVIFALIGLLMQTLRVASATAVGSRSGWAAGLSSAAGLTFIVLFGLFGVPVLVGAVEVSNAVIGCGPPGRLGEAISSLVGAIASVRMLLSFVRSATGAALGAGADIATALKEAGEAVFGMLFAIVCTPIAAYFLGFC